MIKVSVLVLAFNQENFIRQAVESVVAQRTNFKFEILVGTDGSKDKTNEIVKECISDYGSVIQLDSGMDEKKIEIKGKLTGRGNLIRLYQKARGEYVTVLDGDDYWIGDKKLQSQVDWLEKHRETNVCFHAVRGLNGNNEVFVKRSPGRRKRFGMKDVLGSYFVHMSTMLARKLEGFVFPDWYKTEVAQGDWPFLVFHVGKGFVDYLDEIWSCYRIHEGGIWSGGKLDFDLKRAVTESNNSLETLENLGRYLGKEYGEIVDRRIRLQKKKISMLKADLLK